MIDTDALQQYIATISHKEKLIHLLIWLAGLLIINVPSFELSVGVFNSRNFELLVPSLYGTGLNMILFYSTSFLIVRYFREDTLKLLGFSFACLIAVSLTESFPDIIIFRALNPMYFKRMNSYVIQDIVLGNILMNLAFFTIPAIVYGVISLLMRTPQQVVQPDTNSKIPVRNGYETIYLQPDELLYVESEGNYCTYHTENKKYVERRSLQSLEAELPANFSRCHRSYIINLKKVTSRSYKQVHIGKFEIPVGRKYAKSLSSLVS